MTQVTDAQGFRKVEPAIVKGMIIAFSGPRVPSGWSICDGTVGTPNLVDRFIMGDTVISTGTAGGTESAETGLTHSGFALSNHSNHSPTQPGAHSAHVVTQPSAHSNHVVTQPATHTMHDTQGAHTHDAHATIADASGQLASEKLTGPATHASDGGHDHDSHTAHAGWTVDAHSAHAGFAVDAHSAHAGFAVDAHSVHSITQASNHLLKLFKLVYVYKQ